MTSLHLNELLAQKIEKMFPSSVKLDKLELWFNSLKVTIPTPLTDILQSISSKKTVYKFPFSLDNQQLDFDVELDGLDHPKIKINQFQNDARKTLVEEMKNKFECTKVGTCDDPDLGKGSVEIVITEKGAKKKIVRILLTKSHFERRINPEQLEEVTKDKEVEFLLADEI